MWDACRKRLCGRGNGGGVVLLLEFKQIIACLPEPGRIFLSRRSSKCHDPENQLKHHKHRKFEAISGLSQTSIDRMIRTQTSSRIQRWRRRRKFARREGKAHPGCVKPAIGGKPLSAGFSERTQTHHDRRLDAQKKNHQSGLLRGFLKSG